MGRGVAIALGALLFISLAVNVFALGHLSGRMIAGDPPPPPQVEGKKPRGGFEDPLKIMRYAEDMSPELRERFRESFREQLPQMREEHHKKRALRKELGALVSAEEWDAAAIDAKLAEIAVIENRQQKAFTDAFVSVLAALPYEERKALIDAANERRAQRRKEREKRRKEHGEHQGHGPQAGPQPGSPPPPPPPDGD